MVCPLTRCNKYRPHKNAIAFSFNGSHFLLMLSAWKRSRRVVDVRWTLVTQWVRKASGLSEPAEPAVVDDGVDLVGPIAGLGCVDSVKPTVAMKRLALASDC